MTEHCFDDLDNHVVRVTALDVPMPYSKPLLQEVVPNVARITAAIKEAIYFGK